MTIVEGKRTLGDGWHLWDKFDDKNDKLALLAKAMTKGMTNEILCAAFYFVKPLMTSGMSVKM
jgi:hypothetical protein